MKVLVPMTNLTLFWHNSLEKNLHCVCSTVVMQYLLSLFCLAVAYWFLACLPVKPSSEVAVINVFILKVVYCSLFLFFKIADSVFANLKTSIWDRLLAWKIQVEQLQSGNAINYWKQLWCKALTVGRAIPNVISASMYPCMYREREQKIQGEHYSMCVIVTHLKYCTPGSTVQEEHGKTRKILKMGPI